MSLSEQGSFDWSLTGRLPQIVPEGIIGRDVARVDGRIKVRGEARYGADHQPAGVAHAALATATIARGAIASINDSAARAMPGVLAVLTHENVGDAIQPGKWVFDGGHMATTITPLADGRVHYAGQIVALVVAGTFEVAQAGAMALEIRYEREHAAATFGDAGAEEVEPRPLSEPALSAGDLEQGFAEAGVTVAADYATPAQHNNPIELFQATCAWEGEDLTIWESTQNLRGTQHGVASQLGLDPERVRVVSPVVGGGFGSRGEPGQMTAIVALASRRLGRPVKLVATRQQMFTLRTFRSETRHQVRLGAAADGRLTAMSHESEEATRREEAFVVNGAAAVTARLYAVPNVRTRVHAVAVDRQTPGFMRAPAEMPYLFAVESAMDELAWALDLDPLDLRRRNDTMVDPVTGAPYTSRSLLACIDAGAAAFGWKQRIARPSALRDGDELVGYGYATASKPVMMGAADATVTLGPDLRATVEVATHEIGNGITTVVAQVAADRLGLEVADVDVVLGDSRLPATPITAGSNTTASVCTVVVMACEALRARIVDAAIGAVGGPLAGRAASAVHLRGHEACANGTAEPLAAAVRRAGGGVAMVEQATTNPHGSPPEIGPTLIRNGLAVIVGGALQDRLQYTFGAQFAEVRVNRFTGEIRVPRMTGAFAAGRIMNPRTARSQLMGGMIMGLSTALLEETVIDRRTARYVNDDLGEYLTAVNADVGSIETITIDEVDDQVNPLGIKGLGEIGVCGVAAAIANAVYHATGIRVRRLPIRVEDLLGGLPAAAGAA